MRALALALTWGAPSCNPKMLALEGRLSTCILELMGNLLGDPFAFASCVVCSLDSGCFLCTNPCRASLGEACAFAARRTLGFFLRRFLQMTGYSAEEVLGHNWCGLPACCCGGLGACGGSAWGAWGAPCPMGFSSLSSGCPGP